MKSRIAIMLALMFFGLTAHAYSPAPGLWWNPSESGRGYTIDIQNNTMIITAYVYDSGRKSTWFLASGPYDNSTNSFSGEFGSYTGGQCFGCTFTRPTGSYYGNVRITFDSPETGVLYYPGGSTPIQHEVYGYVSKTDYLLGEWSFTLDAGGLLGTQWVLFNDHYTGADGTVYAAGQEDGQTGSVALGAYYSSGNFFIVGIADGTGYSYQYIFTLTDDRRMLGLGTIYLSSSSPSTPTEPSVGSRLLFPSESISGTITGTDVHPKTLVKSDERLGQLALSMKTAAGSYRALHRKRALATH